MYRYCFDWQDDGGYGVAETICTDKGICINMSDNKRSKIKNNNIGIKKSKVS